MTETITRLRSTGPTAGRRNDVTPNWTSPDELDIQGVQVAPIPLHPTAAEDHDGRSRVTDQFELYLPPGADITAADRARVRGNVYEVLGEPQVWEGAGVVAFVRRVAG